MSYYAILCCTMLYCVVLCTAILHCAAGAALIVRCCAQLHYIVLYGVAFFICIFMTMSDVSAAQAGDGVQKEEIYMGTYSIYKVENRRKRANY